MAYQKTLTNNGYISDDFIGTEKDGDLISNQQELVELFKEHHMNTVEKLSGKRSLLLAIYSNAFLDEMAVKKVFPLAILALKKKLACTWKQIWSAKQNQMKMKKKKKNPKSRNVNKVKMQDSVFAKLLSNLN